MRDDRIHLSFERRGQGPLICSSGLQARKAEVRIHASPRERFEDRNCYERNAEKNLKKFKDALDKATDLNNWHAFMNLFSDGGYVTRSLVASANAVVFCYAMYLVGKYDYKVPSVELQRIIKRWIFMTTITAFYFGSTESEVEKEFADLKNITAADGCVSYLDSIIRSKFADDYFNITLPNDLMTASAISPAWFNYNAALNVLGTPMLFSTSPLRAKMIPGASGTKKAIDKQHIFPKYYLTKIGFEKDRERNQTANFTYLDYATNIDISDRPPMEYVREYRMKLGEDGYKNICVENAFPENFEKIEYPEFLSERRKLMSSIVRKAYEKLCS